ncbi:Uncharacterized protein APZ42_027534 [Daphnia magna]|uniref:THAP domain-containing protein n=1 Tax=Daphnia magna TaxID=35525 RepID=A0A164R9V8_9CRUS|nr:Uncharacterized protein APZ42_027534 [Daphnia magna]
MKLKRNAICTWGLVLFSCPKGVVNFPYCKWKPWTGLFDISYATHERDVSEGSFCAPEVALKNSDDYVENLEISRIHSENADPIACCDSNNNVTASEPTESGSYHSLSNVESDHSLSDVESDHSLSDVESDNGLSDVESDHSLSDVDFSDSDYNSEHAFDICVASHSEAFGTNDEDYIFRSHQPTQKEKEKQKYIRRLHEKINRLRKGKEKLKNQIRDLKSTITGLTIPELSVIKQIKTECTEGDAWSCFMTDRIRNKLTKSKKGHRWSQEVIRFCIILHGRSPGAYNMLRKSGMVNLPSVKTLRSYLGISTLDVGFTDIVKKALIAKLEELGNCYGKNVNLALDGVAIKPDESYMKNVDKLIGHVDMADIAVPKDNKKLANKLLTFAINGLANPFCIVVGYFLVNKMSAEELCKLTLHIIEQVEKIGYTVIGAVADNASINTKMFRLINPEGILSHDITNPNDPERKLFLMLEALRRRQVSGFMGSEETIAFMLKIIKCVDERLKWLENFVTWLKDWKNSVTEKENFLTAETFEAITITTKSTIAKILFLLDTAGFKCVLTRKLNSDNLERKFGALRQANGGNYNMDAKAAIYGMEKLLRTGITYSAINCNLPLLREKQQRIKESFLRSTTVKIPKKRALDVLLTLGKEDLAVLDELKKPPDYNTDTACDAKLSTAVTCGFLLLVLDEREICVECKEGLRHSEFHDPQSTAVNTFNSCLVDRGGLNFPSKEFVERMWTIYRFVKMSLNKAHNTRKIRENTPTTTPYNKAKYGNSRVL